MKCQPYVAALSSYVDGEAAPGERQSIEAHLLECASCRDRVESLRALKHVIARLPSREDPPGAVRARIEARAQALTSRRPLQKLMPIGIGAAALAVAAIAVLVWRPVHGPANLAEAIVDDHVRYYPAHDPAEIASADPQVVSQWLSERLPFSVEVPTLPDARLIGGRRCKLAGEPLGLLFYERDGKRLSLFVLNDPEGEAAVRVHQSYEKARYGGGACGERMRGYGLCVRTTEGRSYVLVSELDSHAMGALLAQAFSTK